MARVGIYATDTLPSEARQILEGYDVYDQDPGDAKLAECEVLMTWPSRADKALVARMPRLRAVQAFSAGVDGLQFGVFPPGTKVFSNAGAFTATVAEHAFGILLWVAKGVHVRDRKLAPRVLAGKTLLVLGCGAIGCEVARLSRLLGMHVLGVSRSFKVPEVFDERQPMDSLGKVIGRADAIAIALPLTKFTTGVLDFEMLSRCKPDVTIVNVGRGQVVDEDSLIEWLRARPESRYATDVFWKRDGRETFETKAWELPNFGGTRHDSGVPLGDNLTGPKVEAAKNVRLLLEAGKANNLVDPSEYC